MSQYAAERISIILNQIQELHAEARHISDEYGVPFDLELEGGRFYNTVHEYEGYGWMSSNC